MIVLDIDAAYKAVEVLYECPGFSVKPSVDGFVARIDGYTSFGKTALDATIKLYKISHPASMLMFYRETNASGWY